jgi:hypothetical protein
MIKKITFLLTLFCFSTITAQTNFGWDTAIPVLTETINGITTTVTMVGSNTPGVFDVGGDFGISGNILISSLDGDLTTTVIFNFSEAVNINSILALEGFVSDIDYTFTPSGGSNAIVVASLVEGIAAVNLNWTNVSSFTVTSAGAAFGFDDLLINDVTNFGWETTASVLTETINGITTSVTMVGSNDPGVVDAEDELGSSGNIIVSSLNGDETTTVIFNFSEAVNINSILAIWSGSSEFTFTPSGGSNSVVMASLGGDEFGGELVDLNWAGVTSFTVTSSGSLFGFDNLFLNDDSLSSTDYFLESAMIYPNPVQDFLYLENVSNLNSAKVYNNLGQLVLEANANKIDFSTLNSGVYFLQLSTDKEVISKKIIKK